MKNFKLLLATATILSTTLAMNVRADQADLGSITFNVYATLAHDVTLREVGGLVFGLIRTSLLGEDLGKSVSIDPATGAKSGDLEMFGTFARGEIATGVPNSSRDAYNSVALSFPESIWLKSDEENASEHYCGKVDNLAAVQDTTNPVAYFRYGGRFTRTFPDNAPYVNVGNCSGSGTVTLVIDYEPYD